jgi:hypothetical protein
VRERGGGVFCGPVHCVQTSGVLDRSRGRVLKCGFVDGDWLYSALVIKLITF